MGIIGNDLTLFMIPLLGHHGEILDNLECKFFTKQPLRTDRLVEDMKGKNWEW